MPILEARIAKTAIRKLNSKALALSIFCSEAPNNVEPDLEIPGIMAITWHNPIIKESFEVIVVDRSLLLKYFAARKLNNPVINKPKPAIRVDSKIEFTELRIINPIINKGIVAMIRLITVDLSIFLILFLK